MNQSYNLELAELWSNKENIVHCRFKKANYTNSKEISDYYNHLGKFFELFGKFHLVVHDFKIGPTNRNTREISNIEGPKYIGEVTILTSSKLLKTIYLFTRLFKSDGQAKIHILPVNTTID